MSAHELRCDLFRTRVTGKHRWRLWKGSRIIDSSSQGYASASDRDDNLCEVTGSTFAWDSLGGAMVLQRITPRGDLQVIPVREGKDA